MNIFEQTSKIVITCSNRLAPFLQKDVEELGYTCTRIFKTGVELEGTLQDCIVLNLNLRCASQVLFSLKIFKARNANNLYGELYEFPWENIIAEDGYFSISSHVDNYTMNNNLFANVKIKDAIVDRFRETTGIRPNSGPEIDKTVIHLYWKEDEAEIFIDTSGDTLSKHGYRKIPGKAPMLESLASATLLATNWDKKTTVVNPMCGSGTIAIEAALMATNRRPGLYRNNYGFMHIVNYDNSIYEKELAKLHDQIMEVPELKIIATDISEDAIFVSTTNAEIAGVHNLISFACCDFRETELETTNKGIIYFNPEYGDRLGEEEALEETYKQLGDYLKQKCGGYTGYIFTGNLELAKKIGLKPKKRMEFFTGKIDCRLLEYELYEGTRRLDKPTNTE